MHRRPFSARSQCSSASILQRARAVPRNDPSRRPEDAIPKPYDHVDRALNTHKRRSRLLSATILLLGIVGLLVALNYAPDRQRRRHARELPLGTDSLAVLQRLGERPTRCPAGTMEHLLPHISGLGDEQQDTALARLRRGTQARWLYPGRRGCSPEVGETEVGIDSAGRVLWVLPVARRGSVRLPDTITS
ncbi:MAG TPA: hypothetical protein VFS20_00980 [Longimicrobium sp.]|nr:hypothetical protein [Longimicrobium sp.]